MLIERGKANGWLRLDVNETQEWARLSGVTFSAASATLIPGRGLGLTADRDLTAPLEVLSVAEHLVLSIETVKQHAQFDSDFRGLFESLGASITVCTDHKVGAEPTLRLGEQPGIQFFGSAI